MTALRVLLVFLFACLSVYTAVVASTTGLGFLPVFLGDLVAMGWPGQFNLDFLVYLVLSVCWIAWRHSFSLAGIGLAVLAFAGGGLVLLIYLFWATLDARGDVKVLLVGRRQRLDSRG